MVLASALKVNHRAENRFEVTVDGLDEHSALRARAGHGVTLVHREVPALRAPISATVPRVARERFPRRGVQVDEQAEG